MSIPPAGPAPATEGADEGAKDDRSVDDYMNEHFYVVPDSELPTDMDDPRMEESPIPVSQDTYDATRENAEERFGSDGPVNYSDSDIEALLREVFEESAEQSNRLLGMHAGSMEASNDRVAHLTDEAEHRMDLANKGTEPGDKVSVGEGFDYDKEAQMYEDAGQPVPGWIRNEEEPTQSEMTGLSKMYTNEASSEQSNGQMILNDLKTAQNRYDEARRSITSQESQRHDLAKTIVGS